MTKAQWFLAGAAVSFVVAWFWFTIPRSDSTLYDCWDGRALPPNFQSAPEMTEAFIHLRDEIYATYRADASVHRVAQSCSTQSQSALARAVACAVIMAIDGVEEGDIRDVLTSEADEFANRFTGPLILLSPASTEYRLQARYDGGDWEDAKAENIFIERTDDFDLGGAWYGVGFHVVHPSPFVFVE